MKRKFLALLLSTMMLAGTIAGCGSANAASAGTANDEVAADTGSDVNADAETPSVITVSTVYGDVEVPYAPERICVLDLSTMDIVDSLGLGDKVVCLGWHKHYPSYLEEYYVSETIISLTTSRNSGKGQTQETASTEEVTDPYEIYYGIDADLIIGTTEKIDADLYAVLSQIAPTVALEPALESDNIYLGMRENAAAVASIWGMDEEFETKMAAYDEMYTQLCETVKDKTYVITSGNTDLNSIQIGSVGKNSNEKSDSTSENAEVSVEKSENTGERSETSTEKTDNAGEKLEVSTEKTESAEQGNKKKDNTANAVTFLTQLGMTNITDTVSADASGEALAAAVKAGTSQEDAAAVVIDAVNTANSDAVVVFNYRYSNLDEIRAEGFDLLGIENLNGKVCFISIELTYTTGGLTAVTSAMDQLAAAFLN